MVNYTTINHNLGGDCNYGYYKRDEKIEWAILGSQIRDSVINALEKQVEEINRHNRTIKTLWICVAVQGVAICFLGITEIVRILK